MLARQCSRITGKAFVKQSIGRFSLILHQDPSNLLETKADNKSFRFRPQLWKQSALKPFFLCLSTVKYQNTQIQTGQISLLDHNAIIFYMKCLFFEICDYWLFFLDGFILVRLGWGSLSWSKHAPPQK